MITILLPLPAPVSFPIDGAGLNQDLVSGGLAQKILDRDEDQDRI